MKASRRYPSSTDVARLAGVSQSAVSRAFSEGKSVSEETSRKVFEAAKELGYSPNLLPAHPQKAPLEPGRDRASGTDNPFYAAALQSFTQALQQTGYQVLLVQVDDDHSLDGDRPAARELPRRRHRQRPAGAVDGGGQGASPMSGCRRSPSTRRSATDGSPSVCSDGAGGAAAVAEPVPRARRAKLRLHRRLGGQPRLERALPRLPAHAPVATGSAKVAMATGDYSYDGGYAAVLHLARGGGRCPTRCSAPTT